MERKEEIKIPKPKKKVTNESKNLSFSDKAEEATNRKVKITYHPKLLTNKKKDIFDMTAKIRGRCLIFANSLFKEHEILKKQPLRGYVRDSEILRSVFEQLNFEVAVFQNRSVMSISKKIKNLSISPLRGSEGKPNAFVLIILSHGNQGKIFGSLYDGKIKTQDLEEKPDVLETSEIIEMLNNENCKYLQDRPKIVFIQACQGDKEDLGVCNGYDAEDLQIQDANSQDSLAEAANANDHNDNENETVEESGTVTPSGTLPSISELMICNSTISGYTSYVHLEGSVFGIALARALINHAHDTDLQSLMNKICKEMKDDTTSVPENLTSKTVKQIAEVKLYGWTNKLFFNPGYPKTGNSRKRTAKNEGNRGTKKSKTAAIDKVQTPSIINTLPTDLEACTTNSKQTKTAISSKNETDGSTNKVKPLTKKALSKSKFRNKRKDKDPNAPRSSTKISKSITLRTRFSWDKTNVSQYQASGQVPNIAENLTPVSSLVVGSNRNSIVTVRVEGHGPLGKGSNGSFFRLTGKDSSSSIEIAAFGEKANDIAQNVTVGSVIKISYPFVKFSSFTNMNEIIMRQFTKYEMIRDDVSWPKLKLDFMVLDKFTGYEEDPLDLMIIIVNVGDIVEGSSNGKGWKRRYLEVTDRSKRTLRITVWGALAEFGNFILYQPAAILNVRGSLYEGNPVISTNGSSTYWPNPELEASSSLLAWFLPEFEAFHSTAN